MRTDSQNIAKDALAECRDLIQQRYGADALPESPNYHKTKSKVPKKRMRLFDQHQYLEPQVTEKSFKNRAIQVI